MDDYLDLTEIEAGQLLANCRALGSKLATVSAYIELDSDEQLILHTYVKLHKVGWTRNTLVVEISGITTQELASLRVRAELEHLRYQWRLEHQSKP